MKHVLIYSSARKAKLMAFSRLASISLSNFRGPAVATNNIQTCCILLKQSHNGVELWISSEHRINDV